MQQPMGAGFGSPLSLLFSDILATSTGGYQELTRYWLNLTILYFDVFLGLVPLIGMVVILPRIERRATNMQVRPPSNLAPAWEAFNRWTSSESEFVPSMSDIMTTFANAVVKGLGAKPLPQSKIPTLRPRHIHSWMFFTGMKMMAWIIVIGVLGDLALSVGWHNPLSWDGLYYDFVFARANGAPNGAHIDSYIGIPFFAVVVMLKFRDKTKGFSSQMIGGIFIGASAAAFLGAVHEGLWMIVRYAVYGPGPLLSEQIRDASFAAMCVMLIVTFWKFPKREIPMKVFLLPTITFAVFLACWTFVPYFLGYGLLPITTINNPVIANNFYQETKWFADPWVNALEVVSWTLLWISYSIAVLRFKRA